MAVVVKGPYRVPPFNSGARAYTPELKSSPTLSTLNVQAW